MVKRSTNTHAPATQKKRTPQKQERFRITPKGIFVACMMDAFHLDMDDHEIDLAWELFETRMKKHGYVQD